MAENSKISWADSTFNPWIGCSRVSPGCENCYAENLMDRRYSRVKWGPGQPRSKTKTWNDPVKWNLKAAKEGKRYKVFCASLADWLDEEIPLQWREDLMDLIEKCPNLDWLMLTKRPQNFETMIRPSWLSKPLPQVWYGVTAENQKYWDLRVPLLLALPACAPRWVSYEPSLGPLKISPDCKVDWLIIGGESAQMGPARQFSLHWAEEAIIDCRAAGITPFVKQIGSNAVYRYHEYPVADKAGADPAEWPPTIQVQEFPASSPLAEILIP